MAAPVAKAMFSRGDLGGYILTTDRTVYSWGDGQYGANGDGSELTRLTPRVVKGLPAGEAYRIIPRLRGAYVITDGGDLYSWGRGLYGANGDGSTADNLVAERVLGLPDGSVASVIPRAVAGGDAVGAYVITTGGDLYSWGAGAGGANGVGHTTDVLTPQLVQGLPAGLVEQVEILTTETVFVKTTDGDVYAIGSGEGGRAGNGTTSPNLTAQKVQGLMPTGDDPVIQLAVSPPYNGIVLLASGTILSWGPGLHGANGNSSTDDGLITQWVEMPPEAWPVVGISGRVGSGGGIAILGEGGPPGATLYSWGEGTNGANGNGGVADNLAPAPVQGVGGYVTKVFPRTLGGFAFTANGAYSWGRGAGMANGDAAATDNLVARTVANAGTTPGDLIVRPDPGTGALYLRTTGQVHSWGLGANGANGDGSTADNSTAGLVSGLLPLNTAAAIADRGGRGGLAMMQDGSVYSWGYGASGGLGTGSTADSLSALRIQLPPVIHTSELPAGVVDEPYAVQLTGTGEPPLEWQVGGLPAGLVADLELGSIAGTPTEAGTFTVLVDLLNGVGTDTREYEMTVAAAPEPPISAFDDEEWLSVQARS